ncbi:MAG: hypothetical protein ACR2P7_09375, partial [bacterium]
MKPLLAVEFAFLILWSSGFIGAQYGIAHAGTFTFLLYRYGALTAILFGYLAMRGELRFGGVAQVRRAATMGLLGHCVW